MSLVKTISQRELKNDYAEILRGVEAGEEYTVTRPGVPVARLVLGGTLLSYESQYWPTVTSNPRSSGPCQWRR